MLITIDGHSGSGKTTHVKAVSSALNIPIGNMYGSNFTLTTAIVSAARLMFRAPFRGYVPLYTKILAFHTLEPPCVVDHFWEPFFDVSRKDIDTLITIFRHSLSLCGRSEPNLSIYLDIPRNIGLYRALNRDHPGSAVLANMSPKREEHERKRRSIYQLLESTIPYFHVVDANQSIQDVTVNIRRLLDDAGVERVE